MKQWAAVTSLAKRHADGSLPIENFNLELENQSGEAIQLGSETDQRAVMMGLMLHANAKQLIRREKYKDALEVLIMGELIDNVPILQIDMVWCYFMLRDISWLSVAGLRLSKAREGIERAHGKESSRLRLLQGGRHPEIALHLRMELLEGVVAYHSGQLEKSRQALTSAQTKYFQLQVPDEALSLLMSMGYEERDVKRALRMTNQDIESAVDFLVEEKAKNKQKREDNIRREKEIRKQKLYGLTPLRKPVNLQRLNYLASIGINCCCQLTLTPVAEARSRVYFGLISWDPALVTYDPKLFMFDNELAAEALRRNENDTQKALDDLTNPESNSAMQLAIESKNRKRNRQETDAAIEELISMGFPRAAVVAAVRTFGSKGPALNHLLDQPNQNPTDSSDPVPNALGDDTLSTEGGVEGSSSGVNEDPSTDGGAEEGPSAQKIEDRDVEMEDELTGELQKADAFSDYDIEVTKEGEAINEYLALLASTKNGAKVSSSH
ncbi:ubiquitin-associated (UBA)/TS-N domain-containing protein [Actinidia rufa]|uniref:Ubiquitin-associated (UBA)/TS-N domain-containing protein n=1 Tax=Actinidia rufa TaxID=165716 RepID=A0A7J0DII5_9ERIC|nr:ubiquitin-associated (UBA)/TS-N domain-containing protein [Actinidia rufa]